MDVVGYMVSEHVGGFMCMWDAVCVCVWAHTCARMCIWEPETAIGSSFIVFHFLTKAVSLNKPRTC